MVGLVIVSHSRALAEALRSLVRQVASPDVHLAIAAGVGEDRAEFGTDGVEVSEAIQSVYSADGVLVLMDLGSAVLSAELALELLPPEMAAGVCFCAAPVVEGAIAAAVQAGLGSPIDIICQEALNALGPKAEHLGQSSPSVGGAGAVPAELAPETGEVLERAFTLVNLHGLHARPAARFVQAAASFQADLRVQNLTTGKGPVSARSLNAIATLGAVKDHQVKVYASGLEAQQALDALGAMIAAGFGELEKSVSEPCPISKAAPTPEGAAQAVPISDGVALGPFYRYQPVPPPIPEEPSTDPEQDWERLHNAIEATQVAIRQRRQQVKTSAGEEQAAIFDAHLLILRDPDMQAQARTGIFERRQNPAAAWQAAFEEVAQAYAALDDPYQKGRADDVRDVGRQVLFALAGKTSVTPIHLEHPVILFAHDITPTETSQLDMSQVLAIVTVGGGPTSHSAILARALGIPAVSGANLELEGLQSQTLLGVDGSTGAIWVNPSKLVQTELLARRDAWLAERRRLLETSQALATTRDGHRVEVAANIGSAQDARSAVKNGAEAVGLLRTEFLFLTRQTPPTEAEQLAALREIGEAMQGRPVLVRTLDVGGDKELPYIHMPAEANPFLGVRAVRLSLRQPELFMPQLRAILRAAADFHFRIMFPMVANLDEVLQAKAYLEKAHQELQAENLPHGWPIETGIMVEIPAAALLSEVIAQQVDFFSIGTNDLTQYTLAAERGNPALAGLSDALHPAVLRLIGEVVQSAHRYGKWVGVCGELAGDPLAAPVLVGLGVDELSMNPSAIPRIKSTLRLVDLAEARSIASQVLGANSAAEARDLARKLTGGT